MDISPKEIAALIVSIFAIAFTVLIAVSNMSKEQENKFNSMTAKLIEFMVFWSVMGWSIFQIASEVLLSEPISRWVILKIVLYMSFIIFMVVLRLYNTFISHVNRLNDANKAQNELLKEQISAAKEHQNIFKRSLDASREHVEVTKKLSEKINSDTVRDIKTSLSR